MKRALAKVRSAPARAWRGTARTAKWAGSGVAAGPRRAAGAIGGATRGARDGVRGSAESVWRRSGGARVTASARSSPRVAIAWAVGAILVVAWIGWAIYVTTEHGGAAGLGVLVSWPAAIVAIALVAAPFVGVYLLVQRIREPAIAGLNGERVSDATAEADVGEDDEREDDEGDPEGAEGDDTAASDDRDSDSEDSSAEAASDADEDDA